MNTLNDLFPPRRRRPRSAAPLERRTRVLSRLRTVFDDVKRYAVSFPRELAALHAVYESPDYKKLRHIDTTWLDGWRAHLREQREHNDFVLRLVYRGALVSCEDVPRGGWGETWGTIAFWKHRPNRLYYIDDNTYAALALMHSYPALDEGA